MTYNIMDIGNLVNECDSLSGVCRKLGFSNSGRNIKKVKLLIENSNLDISHFYIKKDVRYTIIKKDCPVCGKVFETKEGHKREKQTCSYSCSNTLFRSGSNNPNWKDDSYRTTCFLYHNKECVVCKENKIVEVHHLDENSKNNSPENLIPLCPTHHQYWHSRYKNEIEEIVYRYINNFKDMRTLTQQQQQQKINRTD